jgi:hypothetical protein
MDILIQILIIILVAALLVYLYFLISNKTDSFFIKRNQTELDNKAAQSHFPKPRYCPVCKSKLGPHDSLFAEMYNKQKGQTRHKVFIHGCRFCYNPRKARQAQEAQTSIEV